MAKKSIIRITTYDTNKTYDFFRGEKNNNPPIWEVGLFVKAVDCNGVTSDNGNRWPRKTIYLERNVLENAGLVPSVRVKDGPKKEPQKTSEELILALLEYVGVYPLE